MTIRLSDMMKGTLNCARNACPITEGESVLLIADTTTDSLIVDAYRIAYESEGGYVTAITIPAAGVGCCSSEITNNTLCGPYPEVLIEAMKAADLCINLSGYADMHGIYGTGFSKYGLHPTDFWCKYHTRMLSVAISNKEALTSDWATYPNDLLKYLNFKAHEHLLNAIGGDPDHAVMHITDLQGTDITVKGFKMCTKGEIKKENGKDPINTFGTEQVGMIPYEPKPNGANAEGVIVATSIHTGYVPEMKAFVKGGRIVAMEGGGAVAKEWMRDFEKGKNASAEGRCTTFGVSPGPGINWIEEIMYGVHPRAFRLGYKYRYQGSETFQAWVGGTRRSGVLHFGIGGGKDEWYRHRDMEVFFPTLTVNGEVLIKDGRLMILDDPEVIKEAAKYGDPDVLLQEKWIPEMPPLD